jgi:hypothetical protein
MTFERATKVHSYTAVRNLHLISGIVLAISGKIGCKFGAAGLQLKLHGFFQELRFTPA